METVALILACCCILTLGVALYWLANRPAGSALQAALVQLARQLPDMQAEIRALSERLRLLEGGQSQVHTSIAQVDRALSSLTSQAQAYREAQAQMALTLQRLEAVIAGSSAKGLAGENVLEALLGRLPPEWQVRNLRIGNRVVEFALRLPNNLLLPIDSKWPATDHLEGLAASNDSQERSALQQEIQAIVRERAREVRKYLDPSCTVGFGLAVVPDAVYELCLGLQAELFQQNVVLVSYSLLLPYLLLAFQMALHNSRSLDTEFLLRHISQAQESLALLQQELEGRYPRALVMLSNCREDMALHLGRIRAALSSALLAQEASRPAHAPAGEKEPRS